MIDFIDKTSEQSGTPLNRKNLMAIQGFESSVVSFGADGSIIETNSNGETKTTHINEDGSITEIFVGEKTIRKTTTLNPDGSITTTVSEV